MQPGLAETPGIRTFSDKVIQGQIDAAIARLPAGNKFGVVGYVDQSGDAFAAAVIRLDHGFSVSGYWKREQGQTSAGAELLWSPF